MDPRLLIAVIAALSAGCLKKLPAFSCTDDSQCGAGGACEANGLCSFANATCPSGREYGAEQGELSNTCVGGAPPTDGPVGDAPTDMMNCPNDLDCDNVVDSDDNCPTVANEDQAAEDNDAFGDACDKCPPFDDNGQDADGDGVGDDCDPHPGATDTLVEFAGFNSMPAGWNATGTFTVAGGNAVATESGLAIGTLMRAKPAGDKFTIWAEATFDAYAGGALAAVGVSVMHAPGGDQHGALCQKVGLSDNTQEELRLFDTSAGNILLDSAAHALDVSGRYELYLEKDGTGHSCDTTNPVVETLGTSSFAPNNAEVGVRVRSASARYHWVMIISSQ